MFKRYTTSIGVLLTVLALGITHIYSPVVRAVSPPMSSHMQHTSSSTCQVACQAIINKQKAKSTGIKEHEDTPAPKPLYFNTVAIETIGVGLLQPGTLWRQSSWLPPDITLLSGHYSSSL